jgi:hypothetical protein
MSGQQTERRAPLDWEMATQLAQRLLTARGGATTILVRRDGSLMLHHYWQEPLQNAALRAVERDRSGVEPLPATTEELAAELARHAKYIDDNRRARERRRCHLIASSLETLTETFDAVGTLDLLEALITRDLFAKFAERLFDVLDPDARMFLEAWLGEGIEFSDTIGFMKRLYIDNPRTVHNIKRRVQFRAQKVLSELYGDRDTGDPK